MELLKYFNENQYNNVIHKCSNYFEVYERHFRPFVDKKIKVLEIGVSQGGSLKMWKAYFGKTAQIIGVDINPKCKQLEEEQIKIYIGDQSSVVFLRNLIKEEKFFDIIIDDGGHLANQQITSFKELYYTLNDGGIYICEDLHTSYWEKYGGAYKKSGTFIELIKNLIDELQAFHSETPELKVNEFTKNTTGIHIYDGCVVFDKQSRIEPLIRKVGIRTI